MPPALPSSGAGRCGRRPGGGARPAPRNAAAPGRGGSPFGPGRAVAGAGAPPRPRVISVSVCLCLPRSHTAGVPSRRFAVFPRPAALPAPGGGARGDGAQAGPAARPPAEHAAPPAGYRLRTAAPQHWPFRLGNERGAPLPRPGGSRALLQATPVPRGAGPAGTPLPCPGPMVRTRPPPPPRRRGTTDPRGTTRPPRPQPGCGAGGQGGPGAPRSRTGGGGGGGGAVPSRAAERGALFSPGDAGDCPCPRPASAPLRRRRLRGFAGSSRAASAPAARPCGS